MDNFFIDPKEPALPPDEVRIRTLKAEPHPDQKRLKVSLELDAFQKRPTIELRVIDPEGQQIAEAVIIEPMTRKLELNLHTRSAPLPGVHTLIVELFYVEGPELPKPARPSSQPGLSEETPRASRGPLSPENETDQPKISRSHVDTAEIRFTF